LTVRAVDRLAGSRADGGTCDGISYLDDGVVLYRTTGNRRENFTLAHELGHWLVDRNDTIYDRLAVTDDPAKFLETVCDRVARLLLLPDDLIEGILGRSEIEARHAFDLYAATQASLHACVLALRDRLPGLGALVVIDHSTGSVRYASVRPDGDLGWPTVYPWPGQSVPVAHPLKFLKAGGTLRQRTFWRMPWGAQAPFYVDAVEDSGRIVGVLSAVDLWKAERFHPEIARDYDHRSKREVRCCGQTRQVRGWPCSDCGQHYCPTCGQCRCQRQAAAEVVCAGGCYMRYLPHLLVDGLCEQCR
jgi:hypothetical protein